MCGIAGYLRGEGGADRAPIERMLDRLVQRGPDDRGVWSDGRVVLGETRLSIIDLSPLGHQPMVTADEKGVITYNGEVYNFRELRAELEREGVAFRSRTDTEVVLYALHTWGVERAVPRFDGMFALAYHDRRDGSVWLARDRMGIKPLYIARSAQSVVFASEVKALLAHPEIETKPDVQAVVSQLIYERLDGRPTPFAGIDALEPGTLLRLDSTRGPRAAERSIKYFDVLRDVDPQRIVDAGRVDFAEHARGFRERLAASVERHLVSDAPLAVMCSGGLDSGLVTAFARDVKPDVVAYVADIATMKGRETKRAQAVARHLGVELRPVPVDSDVYFRLWPRAVYANDQALYFAQHVAAMAVAERMHADGIKVVLSGDGADELFGGYEWYVAAYKLWRRRRLRAQLVNNNPAARALRRLHRWFEPIDLEALARRPFAETSQLRQRAHAVRETVALLPRRELRQAALFRRLAPLPRHEDRAFLALCLEDTYVHMAESLRSKDRMAMAFSVEDRVPYLDNALIDFGIHLPLGAKYRDGRTKPLVHGLAGERLPADVVDLPKIGFWVRDTMWRGMAPFLSGGVVAELLRWSSAEERDLIELLARQPRFLYRVICLELWGRLFLRGESCEQLTEALLAQRARAV